MSLNKNSRILLAAPKSGAGKTLLTCGLLRAFLKRNIPCASFKCGPDYIDPMFHRTVLGIDGSNLDTFFDEEEGVKKTLAKAEGKLAVIEGVMGFYDGIAATEWKASTYDVARVTDTPVIFVLDAKGCSRSAAAMLEGFLKYQKDSHICGVICNRMPEATYKRLIPLFEDMGVMPLGYVRELPEYCLASRHLGLVRPYEIEGIQQKLDALAEELERTLDMEKILQLAETAPPLERQKQDFHDHADRIEKKENIKVAVARDEAFCFYYPENLDCLKNAGIELVPFSPMRDLSLPQGVCGLLLGGGYPELYAQTLSQNISMRRQIRSALQGGMPCLAECGGFLYLHETLEDTQGKIWPMAGVFSEQAQKTARLGRFGYVTLEMMCDGFLKKGSRIRAHEFHYWESTDSGKDARAKKPASDRGWDCMHQTDSILAGFPHLYYPSNPELAENFAKACEQYRIASGRAAGDMDEGTEKSTIVGKDSLSERIKAIWPRDEKMADLAKKRWDSIAKPLHSLGILEDAIVQIAGMTRSTAVSLERCALIICCADNGVVEEGVTQTGQEVTAIVTENLTKGNSCACLMAEHCGVDVVPVDLGVAGRLENLGKKHPLVSMKVMSGTKNMAKEPAMSRKEAEQAILYGIELVKREKEMGYTLLATGEMGIGNTTTSSAVVSVLLGKDPQEMTGRGAGLSDEGLHKKIEVIRQAIRLHQPDKKDGIDVLSKVGGLDLAGMTGVFLGGAIYQIPVVIDGFISAAAALTAAVICPTAKDYMLASHVSAEPAAKEILKVLGKQPVIHAGMCLGEGTGAVAAIPLFQMAAKIYNEMSTFQENEIEEYKDWNHSDI